MQKILFMIAAVVAFDMAVTGAIAATKCVAWSQWPSQMECVATSSESNSTNWTATCTYNGRDTSIRGVAACSSDEHGYGLPNLPLLSLTLDSDNSKNIYCWCKMVAPVESKWVWASISSWGDDTADDCRRLCAYACPRNLEDNGGLGADRRVAIFSNLME